MSAFLGPIHYWLYHKIQLQELLTEAMLSAGASEEYRITLKSKLNTTCGIVNNQELEQVIDADNIHGWLQGQISIAEKRFATAVTEILHTHPNQIETLKQAAYQFGVENPLPLCENAQELYQALNDVLLEGMPCDHVNEVLEQNEERVLWRQTIDLHAPFWEAARGNIEHYYLLRDAFITGSLLDNHFSFHHTQNQFSIQEVSK